jgi:hypothetical protein
MNLVGFKATKVKSATVLRAKKTNYLTAANGALVHFEINY